MRKESLVRKALIGAAGLSAVGAAAGIGVGVGAWSLLRRLNPPAEIAGKVVLITGSTRGLGFAMAQEFAKLGARLVICARSQRELDWARQELERLGAEVLAVRCDVGVADDVQKMVNEAHARFGRIDILVNNAGVISVGPMETHTAVDYEEAMDVMFWGVVYPTLGVLPRMMARREGRIANITSIGGKVSVPHLLPYNCAKFAAVGFSEGLHAEVAKYGIKVSTIVPGLMRVGSHVNAYFKGQNEAEYTWFSMGATMPLVSIDGRRAARKIVRAVRTGRSELIITPQAKLAAMFHGLFPGLTSDILALVNRVLPGPGGVGQERRTGKESGTPVTDSFLTALGRKAGRELHQFPERREGEVRPIREPGVAEAG